VALDRIRAAETWLLESGAPHVTTLLAVWSDGALHFCTGTGEQKYRNLTHTPEVVLATADASLDVVVEGTAVRVTDDDRLRVLAREWAAVHGEFWRFDVRDGAFHHGWPVS
jgi:uncharacterized pyridoxamine 5'-phosphate oxidase family protein